MKRKELEKDRKPRLKRAVWTEEEVILLIESIKQGKQPSDLTDVFPTKTRQQISSKMGTVKRKFEKATSVKLEVPEKSFSVEVPDKSFSVEVPDKDDYDNSEEDCEFNININPQPTTLFTTVPVFPKIDIIPPIITPTKITNLQQQSVTPPKFQQIPTTQVSTQLNVNLQIPSTNSNIPNPQLPTNSQIISNPQLPISTNTKLSQLQPLLYWTFSNANWWYLVVAEAQFVRFTLKILPEGIQVNWASQPTTGLAEVLGMGESETDFYVGSLHGQFVVPAPQPIEHNPRLVQKMPSSVFRVIRVPFVGQTLNEF